RMAVSFGRSVDIEGLPLMLRQGIGEVTLGLWLVGEKSRGKQQAGKADGKTHGRSLWFVVPRAWLFLGPVHHRRCPRVRSAKQGRAGKCREPCRSSLLRAADSRALLFLSERSY